jgi:hypothetical protein
MKIIARAALAAATLVLTAAVPALADGDHGTPPPQAGQKGSPGSVATSGNSKHTKINLEEEEDGDFSQGLLPRVMGQLL